MEQQTMKDQISMICLPKEVWIYQICEFLDTLDLIYSLGRVCKLFRYQIANEYMKYKKPKEKKEPLDEEEEEEEEQVNLIDIYNVDRMKYLIRVQLLNFLVKYEQSLTSYGIFQKINTKSEPHSNNNNIQINHSESLEKLFESRMELFNFYFSHFYQKGPSVVQNAIGQSSIVSSLFSHKDQIQPTSSTKILVVGDGGVGKTTFCKSLEDDFVFDTRYLATIGAEVKSHHLKLGNLETTLNFWDTAGPEKFSGLRDAYYLNSSVCILTFDLTSRVTYKNTPCWLRDVKRVVPNCEIIFVGTKKDDTDRLKVRSKHILFPFKKYYPYISISSMKQENNRAVMWYTALIEHFVSNLKVVNQPLLNI